MEADKQLIAEEEGLKQQPYYDNTKERYVTWGIGHLADPRKPCPIPMEIVQRMFAIDLEAKRADAKRVPGFDRLNEIQQAAIISMEFQLGHIGLLGFRDMINELARGDARTAAKCGRDSKWWREDTHPRAERQMQMLESGLWVPWEATRK
jgi:GH24 family phage-related lysozyme (muramidase)